MKNQRKQIRLKNYNYSDSGAYFVTICTQNRKQILSKICRGGVELLPNGYICENQIKALQIRYNIKINKYIIMPNHIHLIIIIENREEQSPSPTLSDIICAFKSITTKAANKNDNISGRQIWQRSFYKHIIRNEKDYEEIWNYIDTNPLKWETDKFYK